MKTNLAQNISHANISQQYKNFIKHNPYIEIKGQIYYLTYSKTRECFKLTHKSSYYNKATKQNILEDYNLLKKYSNNKGYLDIKNNTLSEQTIYCDAIALNSITSNPNQKSLIVKEINSLEELSNKEKDNDIASNKQDVKLIKKPDNEIKYIHKTTSLQGKTGVINKILNNKAFFNQTVKSPFHPFPISSKLKTLENNNQSGLKIFIDGADDIANALNGTGISQQALSVVQGLLIYPALFPFVYIGLNGLSSESNELKEEVKELKKKLQTSQNDIKNLTKSILKNKTLDQNLLDNALEGIDDINNSMFGNSKINTNLLTILKEKEEEIKKELKEKSVESKFSSLGVCGMYSMLSSLACLEAGTIANMLGGVFDFAPGVISNISGSSIENNAVLNWMLGNRGEELTSQVGVLHGAANGFILLGQVAIALYAGTKAAKLVKDTHSTKEKIKQLQNTVGASKNVLDFNKAYYKKQFKYEVGQVAGNSILSIGQVMMAVCGPVGLGLDPGTYAGLSLTLTGVGINSSLEFRKKQKLSYNENVENKKEEEILNHYKFKSMELLKELTELYISKKELSSQSYVPAFLRNNTSIIYLLDNLILQNGKEHISKKEENQIKTALLSQIQDKALKKQIQNLDINQYCFDLYKMNYKISQNADVIAKKEEIAAVVEQRNKAISILAEQEAIKVIANKLMKEMILQDGMLDKLHNNISSRIEKFLGNKTTTSYKLSKRFNFEEAWRKTKKYYGGNGHQKMLYNLMSEKNKKFFTKICSNTTTNHKFSASFHWYQHLLNVQNAIDQSDIIGHANQNGVYNIDDFMSRCSETFIDDVNKAENKEEIQISSSNKILYNKELLVRDILKDPNLKEMARAKITRQIYKDALNEWKSLTKRDKVKHEKFQLDKNCPLKIIGGFKSLTLFNLEKHQKVYELDEKRLLSPEGLKYINANIILEIIRNHKKYSDRSKLFKSCLNSIEHKKSEPESSIYYF